MSAGDRATTAAVVSIPLELRERRQWVVWKYELVDGERTKVPHSFIRSGRASSTDASTWGLIAAAVRSR